MKSFIKDKLRLILESKARYTSGNSPMGAKDKIYYYTPENIRAEIVKANKVFKSNDRELGSVGDGDGLYEFTIYQSGKGKWALGGKQTSFGKKEPGDVNKSQNGKTLYMYVKANRGVIHPEHEIEVDGDGESHSPMSQAKVKVLFYLGNEILDFIDGSLGYEDGKGSDLAIDVVEKKLRDKVKADMKLEVGRHLTQPELDELHKLNLNLPEVITYLKNNNSKPSTRTQFGRFYHRVVNKETMQTPQVQTYDAEVSDNMDMINQLLKQKVRAKGDERKKIISQIEMLRNS